jgi:hypothetical protein
MKSGEWCPRQDTHGRTDVLRALQPIPFNGTVQRAPRVRRANSSGPLVNGTGEYVRLGG